MSKPFYPSEYEELWRAYAAPANASKKVAYEVYKKCADLPGHSLLLQCVTAYAEFLTANSKPGRAYPKAHLATWLRQARYEGFMDRAEELLKAQESHREDKKASDSASGATWPDTALKALRLSDAIMQKWFLPCTFLSGPPIEILCPSRFHANWLLSHWPQQIERALGRDAIVSFP